jgi:spermidine/putrescine-binding protein
MGEIKIYAAIGLLIAVIGGVWFYGHTRYTAGEVSQKMHDSKQMQADAVALANAATSLSDASTILQSLSAQADANAKAADVAKAQASAAAEQAANAKAELVKVNSAWLAKFNKAKSSTDCQALKEMLCPAVSGY